MKHWNIKRLALLSGLSLMLAACGTSYNSSRDSAPSRPVDVSHVPNAVPKAEPKSRYGNPRSYKVFGKTYYPMESSRGFSERGVASWYGTKFHGRRTSSGERYDMYAMTAAHKTLPLPTYVEVKNLRNGRSVIVKVNDRGPFHDNRIIDLSYAAASKLNILGKGTGLVEIRAIDPGAPTRHYARSTPVSNPQPTPVKTAVNAAAEPSLFLQVGAFSSQTNAERLRSTLESSALGQVIISEFAGINGPVFRVRIGPLDSVETADRMVASLAKYGIESPRVVID